MSPRMHRSVRHSLFLGVSLAAALVGSSSASEVALSGVATRPEQVTALGDGAIFVSRSPENRRTVWWTDGTSAGTHLVVDPCPPPCEGTDPIEVLGSTTSGVAFFDARDPSLGAFERNLWRTDGTPAGTYPLLNASQIGGVDLRMPDSHAITGPRIIFRNTQAGQFIWTSDGTVGGTGPLGGLPAAHPGDQSQVCGGDLLAAYFRLSILGEGIRFYRTDGTAEGTSAPVPIPDPSVSCVGSVIAGGSFWAPSRNVSPDQLGLWTTDGSLPGTTFSGSLAGSPSPIEVRNGLALAIVRDEEGGSANLWVSDGSPAGTRVLKQGTRWESFDFSYSAEMFEIVEPFVFYLYVSDVDSLEVRRVRLDGTDDRLIHVLCSSNCAYPAEHSWLESVGRTVVFPSQTASDGVQLFRLEPPYQAASRIEVPCSSFCEYSLDFHQVIGPQLVFDYRDEVDGLELWSFGPEAELVEKLSSFAAMIPFLLDTTSDALVLTNRHLLVPAAESGSETQLLYSLSAFDVCAASSTDLCLRAARFRVAAHWRDFQGREGVAHARPLTTDTGYFWFFDDANVELTVKVIDGTGLNGYFWVYYGALSNVEYWITVEDTVTGESKEYHNTLGQFGSFGDIEALPADPGGLASPPASAAASTRATVAALTPNPRVLSEFGSSGTCTSTSTSLCLLDGRFQVEAHWTDFAGHSGVAYVQQLTPDTGYFWFFSESNVEVVAKLVDGSAFNQHFWVYYGALSNVEYTLTVTDTVAGGPPRIYHNDLGQFGSFGDITAFPAP